ncbi:MAG: HEAT repeat domain-containing protein [Verrucomicrobia bacterium]|nr:HEAT repeat domain-containing protein [Verrucomicrobiota bacterium]
MSTLTKSVALGCTVLAAVASTGYGRSEARPRVLGLVENFELAERVVIGRLSRAHGQPELVVSEVLKGEPIEVIRGDFSRLDPRLREPDILYVELGSARKLRGCIFMPPTYVTRGFHLWNLAHMLKDPAGYLDRARFSEHVDKLLMLGYLFESYQLEGLELAGLSTPRLYYRDEPYRSFPWALNEVLEFKCLIDLDAFPELKVIAGSGGGELWQAACEHLVAARSHWGAEAAGGPTTVAVKIDARKVPRVGSLIREQAAEYLRARLRSDEPGMAQAALLALARMRDLDSVPAVMAMLSDPRAELVVAALEFLGWARDLRPVPAVIAMLSEQRSEVVVAAAGFLGRVGDRRAVTPLCELLRRQLAGFPRTSKASQEVCRALGMLGDPGAVPELIRAMQAGIEAAYGPLAGLGTGEIFDAILATERETLPTAAGSCMYHLTRRSNVAKEHLPEWTGRDLGPADIARWRQWWQDHRTGFEIVRSNAEAYAIERREHPPRAGKPGGFGSRARDRWVLVGICVLALLGGWVARWYAGTRRR